jgi:DMSO/TMAO reductase YedYZ molybdopterin-dependent catalytic subunit
MGTRRDFVRKVCATLASLEVLSDPVFSFVGKVLARTDRIVVPRGTSRKDLVNKDPKALDTSRLEITPLNEFETMGLEDHEVDLATWRLVVDGAVGKKLELTYADLLSFPPVEKQALLICPGTFVNNGLWKGVSVKTLLERAEVIQEANYVTFRGPKGNYEKAHRVPMSQVDDAKVLLAYAVNGKKLPRKHGFPLRLVASDYRGDDWIKYVHRVTADRI